MNQRPMTLTMQDDTEQYRRERQAQLNNEAGQRAELEAQYGQVWSTLELRDSQYEIVAFLAPFVSVRDKTTGKKGTLEFQHSPRFYFNLVMD